MAAGVGALAIASPASSRDARLPEMLAAQKSEDRSALLFLHTVIPPEGEQISKADSLNHQPDPLLTQPLTARVAIRLDEDLPAASRTNLRGLLKFPMPMQPAGTLLYGRERTTITSSTGTNLEQRSTLYCMNIVVRFGMDSGSPLRCLLDLDNNGALDTFAGSASASDSPGPAQLLWPSANVGVRLTREVKYTRVPIESPRVATSSVEIRWKFAGPKPKQPFQPTDKVKIEVYRLLNCGTSPVYSCFGPRDSQFIEVENGKQNHISIEGSDILILGFTPDYGLRYRVLRSIPSQEFSITLF